VTMIKYLPELVKEQVISQEIAENINAYFQKKKKQGSNKLIVIFAVLGALLVGLGILLIIAHNWDKIPRNIKAFLAFLPLIISQILCFYSLIRKRDNQVWKESAATLLFFSVGACISLISQIYHISGDLSTFLLVWMCLVLPVLYIMNSSFASLLTIIGLTYYACASGYGYQNDSIPYLYWLLLLLIIPYYVQLVKKNAESNFVRFHNLIIASSVIITLGTFTKEYKMLMYIPYFNLFGILLLINNISFFKKNNFQEGIFEIIGIAGSLVLLFILSFEWSWHPLLSIEHKSESIFMSREIIMTVITALISIFLLYQKYKSISIRKANPFDLVFLLFILIYFSGYSNTTIAIVLINITLLFLAVFTIISSIKQNHLGILNLGLLIIAVLIVCRFFDTNMSFFTRGLVFVIVGIGFFLANYRMLKIRRKNEN
jgi:uncharacterized membrane protein